MNIPHIWYDPDISKPKKWEWVLVKYVNTNGKVPISTHEFITIAQYIPPHTTRAEDFLSEDFDWEQEDYEYLIEYDAEKDITNAKHFN